MGACRTSGGGRELELQTDILSLFERVNAAIEEIYGFFFVSGTTAAALS